MGLLDDKAHCLIGSIHLKRGNGYESGQLECCQRTATICSIHLMYTVATVKMYINSIKKT